MSHKRPEWVPKNAGKEYTSRIISSDKLKDNLSEKSVKHHAKLLDIEVLKEKILKGDRTALAKGITLVESNSEKHFEQAQSLLNSLLRYSGASTRIGISGIPGAGKSTLIEKLGLHMISLGHKVAVLAIDPSSTISKGSILGDKTRMDLLSREHNSFIRPSPSGGVLGGVARKTKETIILCEAAGYDTILIETVGVGQSEITVRTMVDFFILMQISGAGDELQGIKKGIMELADLIIVNKADNENLIHAQKTAQELNNVLHYLRDATPGWKTRAITCSAILNEGIDDINNSIQDFLIVTKQNGFFNERRNTQTVDWFESLLNDALKIVFQRRSNLTTLYKSLKNDVSKGFITPTSAISKIIKQLIG